MEVMLGNAMHSLEEYANLAEILPGLYHGEFSMAFPERYAAAIRSLIQK